MRTFRYVLSWFYWLLGVFNACVAVFVMPDVVLHPRPSIHPQSLPILITMGAFIFAAAIVYLMAWWVLRRASISGRRWIIAASIINLGTAAGVSLLFVRIGGTAGLWSGIKLFAIPVVFGVASLFSSDSGELPPVNPIRHA